MRISKEQAEYLKKSILAFLPDAKIYLFGSRVDDQKRGGDIDIMILSHKKLSWKEKAKIRQQFFKKFGEQKIDIVCFSFNDKSSLKEIVLHEGIRL